MITVDYDPCAERYKSPVGGVAVGEEFTINIWTNAGGEAWFVLEKEGEDEKPVGYKMDKVDGGFKWSMHVDSPGLYFYYFEVASGGGRYAFYADENLRAGSGGKRWQLTAYVREQSPDAFDGGIIYQIMVDRFAIGKKRFCTKKNSIYRDDWGAAPYYAANEQGIVPNVDNFGGNLYGVADKLEYLKSLGVGCVYLNPIFEAASNHKYDTGNYRRVDGDFGGNEAFDHLVKKAKKIGIKIILDGVFSHTGADSIYFNRDGNYDSAGAYSGKDSPYYDWYSFKNFPDEYDCWWGVKILPCVREENPVYDEFINGEEGVVRTWLRRGADGWRLDVADELPDRFLDRLHHAVKSVKPKGMVLGEVWENASNKVAYSRRRRYLLGGQLDGVTNYPFKDACLAFAKSGDADGLVKVARELINDYPPAALNNTMNPLSTHDTVRALTALSDDVPPPSKEDRKDYKMTDREKAIKRLKLAAATLYALPGVPSLLYGDEAGMEGYEDPFNRKCYPWGGEDESLIDYFRKLGELRKRFDFRTASASVRALARGVVEIRRGDKFALVVNATDEPYSLRGAVDLFGGVITDEVPALGCARLTF